MQHDWKVYARNPARQRAGLIADYVKLDLVLNFNDRGTWVLDLPYPSVSGDQLEPQWGIEVVMDGTTLLSGPLTRPTRESRSTQTGVSDTRQIAGVDDMAFLAARLAHPEPATAAPPYNTNSHDVRTGVASTIMRQYVDVNAGPGALAARRVSGLSIGVDPVVGDSITGRARWDNLMEFLASLALQGGGLGFRVRGMVFEVYRPQDRSADARFTRAYQNLGDFAYSSEAPTVDYVYVGGGGEGTSRVIYEGENAGAVAEWWRIERFIDQRQTTVTAELTDAATEALSEGASRYQLDLTPLDSESMSFGRDYNLGDTVTVEIDGITYVETIRQVKIEVSPEREVITPVVGTPGATNIGPNDVIGRLVDMLSRQEKRIANLERR